MGMFSKGLTKAVKSKKKTTPTQRSYGKGKGVGKGIGRKQGAAVGGAAGLTVAAIMGIRSKKKLEELKEQNLNANQRAAVNRALRIIAEKEAAKAKMGRVKPKPRDLKRGGAVKKK